MTEKNNDIKMDTTMTAGEMLRTARTTGRRKRELNTIAKQLCIREDFLAALENCEYNKLPEPIYVFGFARNYATELELDPEMIIAKIKSEMGIVDEEDEIDADEEEVGAPVRESFGAMCKRGFSVVATFVVRRWKLLLWIVVAILVIVGAGIAVNNIAKNQSNNTDMTAADNANAPAFARAVRTSFGATDHASAQIVFQANDETWLKVDDNHGDTIDSRVMMSGDVYYVPGNAATATVGNAGGLDVFVNGAAAPRLGPDHLRKTGIKLDARALAAPAAFSPDAAPAPAPAQPTTTDE